MEFGFEETKNSINIVWNGPFENLCRKLIMTGHTREHQIKVYLSYPKMPTNHVICLINRFRKAWENSVGDGNEAVAKTLEALKIINNDTEVITSDDNLIAILEFLGLDNVGADLDLIAIKKIEAKGKIRSVWGFAFSPDETDHFLNNVKINGDYLCYGRNGDESL